MGKPPRGQREGRDSGQAAEVSLALVALSQEGLETYTYWPTACPSCGTAEGGAEGVILTASTKNGREVAILTALCLSCRVKLESEDLRPYRRALATLLPLIEDAELAGELEA